MNRQRSDIPYVILDPQAPPAEPDTSSLEKSNDSPQNISFYLTDHLGNTRVNFRAGAGGTIEVLYAADYFPFGKVLREYKPCEANRFLSTQHERDEVTRYDNRGARLYDSELGRFLGVDPLARKMPLWSSYTYAFSNPLSFVDPDGKQPEPPTQQTRSFVTLRYNGRGSHTVSTFQTIRTYTSDDNRTNGRNFTDLTSVSEVTFYPTQLTGLKTGASSSGNVVSINVTTNTFETYGFTGGTTPEGNSIAGYSVWGKAVNPNAISTTSTSDIQDSRNDGLRSEAQSILNFQQSGDDGYGLAGTPLTRTGNFDLNSLSTATSKALVTQVTAQLVKPRTPIQAPALAVAVSMNVEAVNSNYSDDPKDHTGQTAIKDDTGFLDID